MYVEESVDCLGFTLSQCVMNHTRLESMFRKKHAPYIHAHKTRHTHAYHDHTHDTMYAHVYTFKGCLVGVSPWFGDLENSSYGLVTIYKLLF